MTIKIIIEENKKKAELSIFWQEMSTYLPKTLEREALGDRKIFQAFALTYPSIKKYLFSTLLDEMEKSLPENETRNPNVRFSSNVEDHLNDARLAGKEEYRKEVLSTLNKYRV